MRGLRTALLVAGFFTVMMCGGGGNGNACGGESPTAPSPIGESELVGTVTHVLTGAAIANAQVTVTMSGRQPLVVTSATNGRYVVGLLQSGTARVDASAPGFRPYTAQVSLVRGTNTHNIQLVPNP